MPPPYTLLQDGDLVLDDFPDSVAESLRERDQERADAANGSDAFEFAVADLQRWPPGSRVTVAFRGGSDALRGKIEAATRQITDACDIVLDFRTPTGAFRTWTDKDKQDVGYIPRESVVRT